MSFNNGRKIITEEPESPKKGLGPRLILPTIFHVGNDRVYITPMGGPVRIQVEVTDGLADRTLVFFDGAAEPLMADVTNVR